MAIQHYEGYLGKFDYDDTEFELHDGYYTGVQGYFDVDDAFNWQDHGVLSGGSYASDFRGRSFGDIPFDVQEKLALLSGSRTIGHEYVERLKYIGDEADGSKIHIPEGIKSVRGMFYRCRIVTPPVIPDGVVDCTGMFFRCECLVEPPVIPDSVKVCTSMFGLCYRLASCPDLPLSIEDSRYMFYNVAIDDIDRKFAECKSRREKGVQEIFRKYFPDQSLDKIDTKAYGRFLHLFNRYEESGHDAFYGVVLKDILNSEHVDFELLCHSLDSVDKARAARKAYACSKSSCKIPGNTDEVRETIDIPDEEEVIQRGLGE